MDITPDLLLCSPNGPIHKGFVVDEGDQILRVLSCENFKNNYVYEIEVEREKEEGVVATTKQAVRFNMCPSHFRKLRIENGPYPYVVNEWNGDVSVHYRKGSERYNSKGQLLVTCNLSGAHHPLFVPRKESVIKRVEKATKSLQVSKEDRQKQIEAQSATILPYIHKLIQDNHQPVQEYRAGKKTAINGCMGLVMKQNKALNPQIVRELLEQHL